MPTLVKYMAYELKELSAVAKEYAIDEVDLKLRKERGDNMVLEEVELLEYIKTKGLLFHKDGAICHHQGLYGPRYDQ